MKTTTKFLYRLNLNGTFTLNKPHIGAKERSISTLSTAIIAQLTSSESVLASLALHDKLDKFMMLAPANNQTQRTITAVLR